MSDNSFDAQQFLTVDPHLAFEFMLTFSRFEFAVVRHSKDFRSKDNKQRPMADWKRFSSEIDRVFDSERSNVKDAIDYMNDDPPEILGRDMTWHQNDLRALDALGRFGKAVHCAVQVRNNFFHGGKIPEYQYRKDRDRDLMKHSLAIIRACLEADEELRQIYLRDLVCGRSARQGGHAGFRND